MRATSIKPTASSAAKSHHGNKITEADEVAKLRLVVETAQEVWG